MLWLANFPNEFKTPLPFFTSIGYSLLFDSMMNSISLLFFPFQYYNSFPLAISSSETKFSKKIPERVFCPSLEMKEDALILL